MRKNSVWKPQNRILISASRDVRKKERVRAIGKKSPSISAIDQELKRFRLPFSKAIIKPFHAGEASETFIKELGFSKDNQAGEMDWQTLCFALAAESLLSSYRSN